MNLCCISLTICSRTKLQAHFVNFNENKQTDEKILLCKFIVTNSKFVKFQS